MPHEHIQRDTLRNRHEDTIYRLDKYTSRVNIRCMFQFQLGAIAVSAHHDGAPLSCFEVHPKSDKHFGDTERE